MGASKHDAHQIEERILIRLLDWHLLPILSILYLLSHLNGSNIANTKLDNLEADLNLTSVEYRWCLSIYFLGFILFQIPSNIILRQWRPSAWISLIVFLWGLVAVSMAAVRGFYTLLLARFLLGTFQCGFFPAFMYYVSLWYRRREQALRVGFFWSFAALAGAFGGLIAYAIAQIKPPYLSEWQLIFIVEGIPTIVLAIVCCFYLSDSPESARFLNDKERAFEITRLSEDEGASHNHSFSWSQVMSVFTDWKTYAYAIIYICATIPFQGITLFLPTLIREMGQWTPVQSQLLTIPPYLCAFVTILIVSKSSDNSVERSYHLVFCNLLSIVGFLILLFVSRENIYLLYTGGLLATSGVYSTVSVRVTWINNNFASLTRRAVASAFIISIGAIGGLISGQIYSDEQKPGYFHGHSIALICIIMQTIVIVILRSILKRINQKRSLMNEEEINGEIEKYGGDDLVGDRHPDFRYTL